jgi:hypothetical protein
MTKYRPHRGGLAESMAEVIDVKTLDELITAMSRGLLNWYPKNKLPTAANVTIEPYCKDERIGWDTYIVCVDGQAWGFTDGPLVVQTGNKS